MIRKWRNGEPRNGSKTLVKREGSGILFSNVITVVKQMKNALRTIKNQNGISVMRNAILHIEKKNSLFGSNMLIKVLGKTEKANKFIIEDIAKHIQRTLLISKQEDMQEREVQKVAIVWKSGNNLKNNIITVVQSVVKRNHLQKTIFYLCQKVGQILFQIFNHYVVIATVENGRKLNIYNNPELMEAEEEDFYNDFHKTGGGGERQ